MRAFVKPVWVGAVLVFLIFAVPAFAANKKQLPKNRIGFHVTALPDGYSTLHIPPGATYYYRKGIYYTKVAANDYMIIRPPVGAVVNSIPWSYKKTSINGVTYFTKAGVYYTHTDQGYRIAAAPLGAKFPSGDKIK